MMALTLRDFDAENERYSGDHAAPESLSDPETPLYSFTEEELGKLLADARQQGFDQGREEGLTKKTGARRPFLCFCLLRFRRRRQQVLQFATASPAMRCRCDRRSPLQAH